jgi:hypothetical protein
VGKQASAIPSQLTGYSGWASFQNGDLKTAARKLNAALEKLNQAKNSSYVLGQVEYVGNDVLGYAARNEITDSWVGDVGRAFSDADRQGVNPQLYKANYQDFQNSKATVSDKAVTSRVGGDPVKAGEQNSAATKLAAALREAEDTGNAAQVKAIISQLEAHQYDPAWAAAFFKELGPDETRFAIEFIYKEDDPENVRLLTIYDTALASATNSDGWDPDFNSQMWKQGGGMRASDSLLLKYQTVAYSEDFLTKAADSALFYPEGTLTTLDPKYAKIIFNALAQNPDASLHYLLGSPPDGKNGTLPGTRIMALLRDYQNTFRTDEGGSATALSSVLAAAGRSSDAMQQYVGPFGTEPQIQVLLHVLSGTPDAWVPEGIRPGINQVICEHIDLFVPHIDPKHPESPEFGSDWTWQEKIFKMAVADNEGHVDIEGVRQLQNAVQQWALLHVPDVSAKSGASLDAFRAYMYQVGTLWALAALPVRQGGYDKEHFREEQIDAIKTLVGLIPIPVPLKDEGAKKVAEYMVDHVDEWSREIGAKAAAKAGGDADKESVEAYYRQLGGMRLMLSEQYVAQHPGLVKGMTSTEEAEYIHQLAEGTDPSGGSDADVAAFELELDSASKTFAEQYNNPKR